MNLEQEWGGQQKTAADRHLGRGWWPPGLKWAGAGVKKV